MVDVLAVGTSCVLSAAGRVEVAPVEAPAALAADGRGVAAGVAALPHPARALADAAVADLAERAALAVAAGPAEPAAVRAALVRLGAAPPRGPVDADRGRIPAALATRGGRRAVLLLGTARPIVGSDARAERTRPGGATADQPGGREPLALRRAALVGRGVVAVGSPTAVRGGAAGAGAGSGVAALRPVGAAHLALVVAAEPPGGARGRAARLGRLLRASSAFSAFAPPRRPARAGRPGRRPPATAARPAGARARRTPAPARRSARRPPRTPRPVAVPPRITGGTYHKPTGDSTL